MTVFVISYALIALFTGIVSVSIRRRRELPGSNAFADGAFWPITWLGVGVLAVSGRIRMENEEKGA